MTRPTRAGSPHPTNDQLHGWLLQAAAGDKAATERLLSAMRLLWLAIGRRILGHEADAQEVPQQAAVKLLTGLDKYDPARRQARAWLSRIGANVALDLLRRRRGWAPLEELPRAQLEPADEAARREEAEVVRGAVAGLPGRQREALRLRFYEGLTLAQTARRLGLASATAAHRLVRRAMAAVAALVI